MKKNKRKLLSIITILSLILNLSIPSIINAHEILKKDNSEKSITVGIYGNSKETIYQGKDIKLEDKDTAFTILKRIIGDKNIDYTKIGESTILINSIFGLKDNSKDGWIYAINRNISNQGWNNYNLKDGDELIIHYDIDKMNPQILKSYNKLDKFIKGESGENNNSKITLSIERRVLGQPDILKPTEIEIKEGEKASYVFDRVIKGIKLSYEKQGSLNDTFYLSKVYLNSDKSESLQEKEHGAFSGWMYSVNGVNPSELMSDYRLKDGDTIRIHYTAQSYGEDIKAVDEIYKLKSNLNEIFKLNEKEYTKESWKDFQEVVESIKMSIPSDDDIGSMMSTSIGGEDIYDAATLKTEMESFIQALNDAKDTLEKIPEVDKFIKLVEKLPEVITSENFKEVDNSIKKYNLLSEDQKKEVPKATIEVLENAKEKLKIANKTFNQVTIEKLPLNIKVLSSAIINDSKEYKNISDKIKGKEILFLEDVNLKNLESKEKYNLSENEKVNVVISYLGNLLDYKNISIVHQKHDGTIEFIGVDKGLKIDKKENKLSFELKSLSPVGIIGEKYRKPSSSGGGSISSSNTLNSVDTNKIVGNTRYETAIKVSKEGWNKA
ncbi:DUF4430 domain-containing protein, partial [Romboutsia maritimum]